MVNQVHFPARLEGVPPGGRLATGSSSGVSFAATLATQLQQNEPVRFSAHASQRLEDRQVQLSPVEQAQLEQAVDQLAAKGGRESLLLMNDVALVVNVPNRTVITAMAKTDMNSNVFTNIDSAVVLTTNTSDPVSKPGPAPERGGLRAADRLMRRTVKEI